MSITVFPPVIPRLQKKRKNLTYVRCIKPNENHVLSVTYGKLYEISYTKLCDKSPEMIRIKDDDNKEELYLRTWFENIYD